MKRLCLLLASALLLLTAARGQSLPAVSVLGDSYSTYAGYLTPDTNAVWYRQPADSAHTDVTSVEQTWWHLFIKRNGCKLGVNNSFSGSTVCHTGYRKADYADRSFVTRMTNLGSPDILFIFGATNDSWAGVPIGEFCYGNWSNASLYTFRPAMAYMLHELKQRHPNTRIYYLLNNGLSQGITQSAETICAHYAIPCIKLENIDKKSGHPSVRGMEQICLQIEAYIKKHK